MSGKSIIVEITPTVLKWARETAGYSVEGIAEKIDVTAQEIECWENGDSCPSITKLRAFSQQYKRTLATFFLPNPPAYSVLPKDFRILPSEVSLPLSPKSLRLIRYARQLQNNALELVSDLELKIRKSREVIPIDNAEALAEKIRAKLGVHIEEQFKWSDSNRAFKTWRQVIETEDILVFQVPLPTDEIRGCTLYGDSFPAIVISSPDSVNARIFTLFHEYAHILIGREGICLPEYKSDASTERGEVFCNHFAGAFLVPKNSLLQAAKFHINIDNIKSLARKFKVSKYVILRRLQITGALSLKQYQVLLVEMMGGERPSKKSKGGPSVAMRCIAEKGRRYVSLVFQAQNKGTINYSDMSKLLGVKIKHFREVNALSNFV